MAVAGRMVWARVIASPLVIKWIGRAVARAVAETVSATVAPTGLPIVATTIWRPAADCWAVVWMTSQGQQEDRLPPGEGTERGRVAAYCTVTPD
jgi:hypothetical protein